jgi:hypothetical protein
MNKNIDSLFTNITDRLDYPEGKLRQIKKKLYLFSAVVLGLVFLLSIISQYLRASSTFNTFWKNSFTHSLFESYCGIISPLLMSSIANTDLLVKEAISTFTKSFRS